MADENTPENATVQDLLQTEIKRCRDLAAHWEAKAQGYEQKLQTFPQHIAHFVGEEAKSLWAWFKNL